MPLFYENTSGCATTKLKWFLAILLKRVWTNILTTRIITPYPLHHKIIAIWGEGEIRYEWNEVIRKIFTSIFSVFSVLQQKVGWFQKFFCWKLFTLQGKSSLKISAHYRVSLFGETNILLLSRIDFYLSFDRLISQQFPSSKAGGCQCICVSVCFVS